MFNNNATAQNKENLQKIIADFMTKNQAAEVVFVNGVRTAQDQFCCKIMQLNKSRIDQQRSNFTGFMNALQQLSQQSLRNKSINNHHRNGIKHTNTMPVPNNNGYNPMFNVTSIMNKNNDKHHNNHSNNNHSNVNNNSNNNNNNNNNNKSSHSAQQSLLAHQPPNTINPLSLQPMSQSSFMNNNNNNGKKNHNNNAKGTASSSSSSSSKIQSTTKIKSESNPPQQQSQSSSSSSSKPQSSSKSLSKSTSTSSTSQQQHNNNNNNNNSRSRSRDARRRNFKSQDEYVCEIPGCTKIYTTKGNLNRHLKDFHRLNPDHTPLPEGDTGHRPKGPKKKKVKQVESNPNSQSPSNTDNKNKLKEEKINNGLLVTPKKETFDCDECGQLFVDQILLKKHKSNSHSLSTSMMREFYCIQSNQCRDHDGFSNINACKDHGKNKHAIPEHEINEYVTKCRQAAIIKNNHANNNKFSAPPLPPTPNGALMNNMNSNNMNSNNINSNNINNNNGNMASPGLSASKRGNKKRPNFANRLSNTSNAFGAGNGNVNVTNGGNPNGINGGSSSTEITLNGCDSQSTISQDLNSNLNQIITNHHNHNNPNPFKQQTPLQTQVCISSHTVSMLYSMYSMSL